MKLAVIFPGIGYHVDKPLLYYSRKLALQYGYQVINVPYGNFPADVKGSEEKMREAFQSALSQTEEILKDVPFENYEEIVFIAKKRRNGSRLSLWAAASAAYQGICTIRRLRRRSGGWRNRGLFFTEPGIPGRIRNGSKRSAKGAASLCILQKGRIIL